MQKVAPYLTLDSDAYPAIVDGRIVWIVDGYTTTRELPVLAHRAAVERDRRHLHAAAGVRARRHQLHPQLGEGHGRRLRRRGHAVRLGRPRTRCCRPGRRSSRDAQADERHERRPDGHVRYPADLFKVQRAILGTYHVTDAGTFYSATTRGSTPNDPTQPTASAKAAAAVLPDDAGARHGRAGVHAVLHLHPAHELGRRVAERADRLPRGRTRTPATDYGKLTLLTLPKDDTVPGPGQVQNHFTSDTEVAERAEHPGARRHRGDPRQPADPSGRWRAALRAAGLRPVDGGTSYPLLRKVLVAFGDKSRSRTPWTRRSTRCSAATPERMPATPTSRRRGLHRTTGPRHRPTTGRRRRMTARPTTPPCGRRSPTTRRRSPIARRPTPRDLVAAAEADQRMQEAIEDAIAAAAASRVRVRYPEYAEPCRGVEQFGSSLGS